MNGILDAPAQNERSFEYAGFWIRVIASFIDGIVLLVVQLIVTYAVLGDFSFMRTEYGIVDVINWIVGIGYYVLMESSAKMATLGKMAVGIRVTDDNGGRITALRALGRYLSKLLSFLLLFIGVIMVAFDSKKQGLHDKIAGTIVTNAD